MAQICLVAVVTWNSMFLPKVAHVQHSSTATTAQHTGKQRASTPAGLRFSVGVHESVGCHHSLNFFILLPVDVTGMVLANKDTPFRARFELFFPLANTAFHNLCPYFSSSVDISAGIERVGQNRQHRAIDWWFPYYLGSFRMMRERRQRDVLFAKPD